MSERLDFLIVGGGPAGFAAANAYREHETDTRLAIITDEYVMPYNRPPLTKEFLRGEMKAAELPLESESWLNDRNISLIGGRAVALDPRRRSLTLSGGRSIEYEDCLMATGAEPTRLPVPGSDHPRVRVIRTLQDVRLLLERLDHQATVAVVGSGFIGCEIASSLRLRGHDVHLISDEDAPNTARLGSQASAVLRSWLENDGVKLHFGVPVERITHRDSTTVIIAGDEHIPADVVVMASGVRPRSELARQAGVRLDDGAIAVSSSMCTGVPGLLAAGDVCMARNDAAARSIRVEHWGDALAQGEIAGRTAAGDRAVWDSVPGFWSTIGAYTLKYAAWGDGFDQVHFNSHQDGGFTAWYGSAGRLVGVLTHDHDSDYENGQTQIKEAAAWPF